MQTIDQLLFRKGADVIGATPATTVREAVRRMIDADVSCLVVEQRPDVLGIVTERDVTRRFAASGKDPAGTHLAEIMTSPVASCSPEDTVLDCARRMLEENLRHLVVLDRGDLAGVVSLRDVLDLLLARSGRL